MAGSANNDENRKSINERITSEKRRLKKFLTDVSPDKKKAADGLISRAAFMLVTLEEYEKDLITNGHTEMFSQSPNTDPYERERPVARLYNSLIKNYQACMKTLFDMLPEKPADSSGDDPTYNKFFSGKGK